MRKLPVFILMCCMGWAVAGCVADSDEESRSPAGSPPGANLTKCGIVLERGAPDAWDGGMVESPVVWYDSTQQRYGMVYTGYDLQHPQERGYDAVGRPRIGLAWSDDLLTWSKDEQNPIFGPSRTTGAPDEAGTAGPFLWMENSTYYLFYFGTTDSGYEGGRKTMNVATSENLTNWTRYAGNPIIEPKGSGWRRDAIWHPHLQKVDGTYYLFFNASGVVDGHHEEYIGYATSSDLFDWTVHDEESPILTGSREDGAWDATGRAGDPSLYRVGDIWYMAWYSWNGTHAQDGLAWTSAEDFPLGWTRYAHNPILSIGSPDRFDGLHAAKPFVYRTDTRHHHFYTAVDTAETREIAVAVEPGPCTP